MQLVINNLWNQIGEDERGQDLIEYALIAAFVAFAASAIMPGIASSINVVMSQVNSVLVVASSS